VSLRIPLHHPWASKSTRAASSSTKLRSFCESTVPKSVNSGVCASFAYTDKTNTGLEALYLPSLCCRPCLLLQARFVMLCACSVRQKNVKNIIFQEHHRLVRRRDRAVVCRVREGLGLLSIGNTNTIGYALSFLSD
jgi:hypothetical protein